MCVAVISDLFCFHSLRTIPSLVLREKPDISVNCLRFYLVSDEGEVPLKHPK